MKKVWLVILLVVSLSVKAQIITTICGTAVSGGSIENIPATASPIRASGGGVFDNYGNFYFDQCVGDSRISRINILGIINTVAGTGVPGYSGDLGPATSAQLKLPNCPGVDKVGNIYIPDGNNNRIRKVDITTGIITTIAGTGTGGFNGDGIPATAAMINGPSSIDCDKHGNIYIADYNNGRVRKIDNAGKISTVVGTGVLGFSGDGGPATAAKINGVIYLKFDDIGNLYMADQDNGRIRKMDTLGIITTVAGNGSYIYSGDEIPATNAQLEPMAVTVDKYGNVFIADNPNNMVRYVDKSGIIHKIAGTGVGGYNGDGISATAAQLNWPAGVALDSCGNVYILDSRNYRIRKVTFPKCNYLEVPKVVNNSESFIYPNPTFDLLHIDNLTTPTTYHLLSITGATMQQGTLQAGINTLSIQTLPPGMYLLELINEEKEKTMRKIIKE